MNIITIPDGMLFGPECGWGQIRYDQVDESEADGSSDVRVRGRPRWTCSLVPPQRLKQGAEAQKWESMLLGLKGRTNVLAAYDPVRPLPAGGVWSTVTIAKRSLTCTSLLGVQYSEGAYTDQAHQGGALVAGKFTSAAKDHVLGLNSAQEVYGLNFDYCFFGNPAGELYVFVDGAFVGGPTTYNSSTSLVIIDNGLTVRWFKDATLLHTAASSGVPLYGVFSFGLAGSKIDEIYFLPQPEPAHCPAFSVRTTGGTSANFAIDGLTLDAPEETVGRTFSAGDKIQLGGGFGTSELVRIQVSGPVDAAKQIFLALTDPLRLSYAAGASVTTEKPLAYFGAASDRVSWGYNGTGLLVKGYSFDGRERWR